MAMASSSASSLLSATLAVAEPDADDLLDSPLASGFCFLLALLGLGALLAQWLKTRGAPSSRRKRAPRMTPTESPRASQSVAARVGTPVRRSVITLHAVTPGQRPHEYNVGDGTRGSALARVA